MNFLKQKFKAHFELSIIGESVCVCVLEEYFESWTENKKNLNAETTIDTKCYKIMQLWIKTKFNLK